MKLIQLNSGEGNGVPYAKKVNVRIMQRDHLYIPPGTSTPYL